MNLGNQHCSTRKISHCPVHFKFIFPYSLNDLMQIIIPVIIHNEKNTTGINVSFAIKLINHPSLPLIILWWKRVYVKTIKKPISPNPRKLSPRACLKNHSRNLHAPLCGIFCPNSVVVARYDALIRTKSPINCDAHLA